MIKLFASDLDGTLLTNHVVDDIVLDAVRTICEHGRKFAVVTGRPMYAHQRAELGLETFGVYTAAMNGAVLYDPEGTTLYRIEIPTDLLAKMLRTFPDMVLEFNTCDRMLVRQSREEFIRFVQQDPSRNVEKFLSTNLPVTMCGASEETILCAGILKINAHISNPDGIRALEQFLRERDECIVNRPFREDYSGLFEITSVSASKEYAVMYLQEKLAIQSSEIAVYGDGPNDCEMLRRFPNSFAPENAATSAKSTASQVIGVCENHAVPRHMLRML